MTPLNRQKEYIAHRVLTASPMELVRILYEAGIQALGQAIEAQHSGDVIERGRAISKAVEILSELQASLRHDVREEYSRTLGGLYTYMRTQLMRAHAEQSLTILQEITRLLNTLMEGWIGAMEQLESGAGADSASENCEHVTVFSGSDPYSGDSGCLIVQGRSWQL